jgi:hypothetical protein
LIKTKGDLTITLNGGEPFLWGGVVGRRYLSQYFPPSVLYL